MACLILFALPRKVCADDISVPIALQVPLLTKVAEYDRHFAERAQGMVHVLIVTKAGNADSLHAGTQMQAGLGRIDRIAGLPHDEALLTYSGATQLAELCRNRHASIVFFSTGLRDEIGAVAQALSGSDVLTASAVPDDVRAGIVLGFDLISSRPKVMVNLRQARLQNIDFRSDLLRLAVVFE